MMLDKLRREELAKNEPELIREGKEVHVAIMNLACPSPNSKTQI